MGIFDILNSLLSDPLDWIESASDEELEKAYDEDRTTEFKRTGVKTYKMKIIGEEMSKRYVKEQNEKHSDSGTGQHRPWNDGNRWDK